MLVFNIAAFTNKGTVRDKNEDSILVNGLLSNNGNFYFTSLPVFHCFVADGVGGNPGGAFASHFVLKKLQKALTQKADLNIEKELSSINSSLIYNSSQNIDILGAFEGLNYLDLSITGSGNINAFPAITNECEIYIEGSGSCSVSVENLLDVRIEGSGDVFYKGNPTINANISGSGKIININ